MCYRLFILAWLIVYGQCSFAGEYPDCTYHKFRNGKTSTSQCYDANRRFGKARAYDGQGKLIYEREIRRVGGHSSVEFAYYSSGAVKQASWRSAPDGGIQWYSSITTFSEDGKVIKETVHNYDDSPLTGILREDPKKKPKESDSAHTAYCAVIYSSQFWFINTTRYSVIVTAVRNTEHIDIILKPGEEAKGGQMIQAEFFDDPDKYYKFSVRPQNAKLKRKLILTNSSKAPENIRKDIRRYFYEIHRII